MGAGIDATVSAGWFNKFSDILGKAWFKSAGLCFFGCGGGSLIETELVGGKQIGTVLEAGGGMGVELSAGHCTCEMWPAKGGRRRVKTYKELSLKKKCPADDSVLPIGSLRADSNRSEENARTSGRGQNLGHGFHWLLDLR